MRPTIAVLPSNQPTNQSKSSCLSVHPSKYINKKQQVEVFTRLRTFGEMLALLTQLNQKLTL